ncbi:transcription factor TGA1-like [Durio zibethinus]|uniref:Transcription factor TGA1-like n=1 Tax=Durio zibethinus TaxID=66656 RepID=A0A6P5ZHD2_DURZI|nr:transcription factor TGA1-like [Durio zibethinus]
MVHTTTSTSFCLHDFSFCPHVYNIHEPYFTTRGDSPWEVQLRRNDPDIESVGTQLKGDDPDIESIGTQLKRDDPDLEGIGNGYKIIGLFACGSTRIMIVEAVICSKSMNSPSTQFVPSRRMVIYEPIHQIGTCGENFKSSVNPHTSSSLIVEADYKMENESETGSHEMLAPSNKYDQEATKPIDKIQRRLAQNREAARKSRLRKKAYVQQLEHSRLKLIQLEQELERTSQQGLYMGGGLEGGHLGFSGAANSGLLSKH